VLSFSDKFLDETTQFWQPRVGHSLNREHARQIAGNVVGFFQLLEDWDALERPAEVILEPVPCPGHMESNLVMADENGLSRQTEIP